MLLSYPFRLSIRFKTSRAVFPLRKFCTEQMFFFGEHAVGTSEGLQGPCATIIILNFE